MTTLDVRTGMETPLNLALELVSKNNISIIGPDAKVGAKAFTDTLSFDLSRKRSYPGVDEIAGVTPERWRKAWAEALKVLDEVITEHAGVLPSAVRDMIFVEPRLIMGDGVSRLASASFALITFEKFSCENTILAIRGRILKGAEMTISALPAESLKKAQEITENAQKKVDAAIDAYLAAIAVHELTHLLARKVMVATFVPGAKEEAVGGSSTPAMKRWVTQHVSGTKVSIPSKGSHLGEAINEVVACLVEHRLLRGKGYSLDFEWGMKTSIKDSLGAAASGLSEDAITRFFLVLKDTSVYIVENKDKHNIYCRGCRYVKDSTDWFAFGYYNHTRNLVMLSNEIFADEIKARGDDYRVTLRRSLAASASGKVGMYFQGAKFNGLESIVDPKEKDLERQKYLGFLLEYSSQASVIETVLVTAFVQAGGLSPQDALCLRRGIIALKKEIELATNAKK